MKKTRFTTAISLLLAMLVGINSIPLTALADELNQPNYYAVESSNEYEVTTNISPTWENHANVEMTFINTGSEVIHNWAFTFNMPYEIIDIWGGTIVDSDNSGVYTVKNSVYNQDIPVGGSVTIGMTLSSSVEEVVDMPSWYLLNTKTTVVSSDDYSLTYQEQASWDEGFVGTLLLENSISLEDWSISFTSNRDITQVNSYLFTSDDENNYVISNDGTNQNIYAGISTYIGIQGVNSDEELILSNVELSVVELALNLDEDANDNGIADYMEIINPDVEIPDITPTVTPTDEPTVVPTITEEITDTPTPTPIEEITPTPEPTTVPEIDWDTDTDGDGLPDDYEDLIGTDKTNVDTDNDGLSDLIEVIIGYNPLSNDTYANGILDGNEDFDNDGIPNLQEIQLGTDLTNRDSDNDGLSDGDEVNIYNTNPCMYDTDEDGLSDGEEVLLGKNPLDASDANTRILQTATTVIDNEEDAAITAVDITMESEGYLDYEVYAEDLYNIDVYSTDVYGRVGSPIGLNAYIDFDTATITIHYDESELGDTLEENLGVLWYDEDTRFYITQEQAIIDTEANTVTLELSHFSTYVLVDLNKWDNPILPDYSDYMYVTTYSTESIEWEGTQRTAEAMENGEFGWWKLSNRWRFERLCTISATCTNTTPGKALSYYLYEYEWLVADKTDDDEDGVRDFIERKGALGTNKHIYYAGSGVDLDSEGMSDNEEFGTEYVLVRSNDGHTISVIYDGVVVYTGIYGAIEASSPYANINGYLVDVAPGEVKAYFVINSDPSKIDTDGDYYLDNVDPRPLVKDLITYNLGGGAYNPFEKDTGYIYVTSVPNKGSEMFYGGNQSWFNNVTWDNSNGNDYTDLLIKNTGCGIIATNDVNLYISNIGHRGIDNPFSYFEYKDIFLDTYDKFVILNFFGLRFSFSQRASSIIDALEEYNYTSYSVNVSEGNSSHLFDKIVDSLFMDKPIILLESDFLSLDRFHFYKTSFGNEQVFFEQFINDGYEKELHFHFVTITGVVNDLIKNEKWLRVQSWGEEYYVKYSDFVEYNQSFVCTGSLIFIE